MAKMVKEVYGHKDGKTVLLKVGDEAPKELAEKLVAKGYAVADKGEKESEDKGPSAADIVKLIKSAESLEEIESYSEDDRKTVKEAFEAKLSELSE